MRRVYTVSHIGDSNTAYMLKATNQLEGSNGGKVTLTSTIVPSNVQTSNKTAHTIRYDTIRDAILTCARKPTRVSLIYRTEPTTKKCKNRKKLKVENRYAQK